MVTQKQLKRLANLQRINNLEREVSDWKRNCQELANQRDAKSTLAGNLRAELDKRDKEIEMAHLNTLFCNIRAINQNVGDDVVLSAVVRLGGSASATIVLNVGDLRRAAVVAKKYFNI